MPYATPWPKHPEWELVLVDDGSRDHTPDVAEEIAGGDDRIRVARLARNYGQTQAIQAGFDLALGDVVVSMDGDRQNDPVDIPRPVAQLGEGYDLVAGYHTRRKGHFLRRKVPSRVANLIIRFLTRVNIQDTGGSLKAYLRWTLDRMPLTQTCIASSRLWRPPWPAPASLRFRFFTMPGNSDRASTGSPGSSRFWPTC